MNLNYRISRFIVRTKQNIRTKKYNNAVAKLNSEQLTVFNLIMEMATKHRACIRFDPEVEETLIVTPDKLFTINKYKVNIDNTHGFLPTHFPNGAYDIMEKKLKKEGHKERRRLKHEVKVRKQEFLDKIVVEIDN